MSQIFTSRIKASDLAEMFVSANLIGKNLASHENSPMTHFGAMKMRRNISNVFNFSLSGPI